MAEPRPGDYGLVTGLQGPWYDRLAARLIQWGTGSPYHHAFIYIGGGQVIEAVRTTRISPLAGYGAVTWSTGRLGPLEPDDAQRARIVSAARARIGTPYNVLDLLAIALAQHRLGRLVGSRSWIARRLSNDGHLICSQLVDVCYADAGIQLFQGRLPGLVSPGDLGRLLQP